MKNVGSRSVYNEMKSIGENSEVINYFVGNLSLLDAEINKYEIHLVNHVLEINIYFQLSRRTKEDIRVLLTFKDVVEYNFYHNSNYIFYNVENLKFLETERGFYFSSDPYHTDGVSENDNDFVMSKGLEAFLLA